jgi:hypothetical protein
MAIALHGSCRTLQIASPIASNSRQTVTRHILRLSKAFGAEIDYAMLQTVYGASPESAKGRYSPADCIGIMKTRITGNPDKAHVSTSYSERSNLTMRMHNRRFTRLTNAFSKKFENHAHMVSIYAVWYNWLRIHKTLRVTPAMAAGLSKVVMDWSDIIVLMDADAADALRARRAAMLDVPYSN